MTTRDVLEKLASLGAESTRRIYQRHGVTGPAFGVSYANLKLLTKELKSRSDLAAGLWASGNHDARVLAAMIADPVALGADTLERWAGDLANYPLTDALADLAAKSPAAAQLSLRWRKAQGEWISSAGWKLLGLLAADGTLSDAECEEAIGLIQKGIHAAPNRTRYEMNRALIALGGRGEGLQDKAIAAAKAIGPVEVDHGETSCETPDAASYILKMAAHRAKKPAAKKPAAKKGTAAKRSRGKSV